MLLVENASLLADFCARAATSRFCAVDTEFRWLRTYWPEPALVQLAVPGETVVVDLLAVTAVEPLAALLANPSCLKVLHAAGQDVRLLYRLTGVAPAPVFDSQIAAGLAGLGYQIGYAELVRQVLQLPVDKGEQFADWLIRPLREEQIRYAGDDVAHLAALFPMLEQRLSELGRLSWALEDSAVFASAEYVTPVAPAEAHRNLRGRIPGRARPVLRALAAWREDYCRSVDLRPCRVVPDHLLIQFACRGTLDPADVRRERRSVAKRVQQLTPEMTRVVEESRHLPPENEPGGWGRPGPAERAAMSRAVEVLAAVAAELGIDRECLASRAEVEALARHCANRRCPPACRLLDGWRRAVVGERLLAALAAPATGAAAATPAVGTVATA